MTSLSWYRAGGGTEGKDSSVLLQGQQRNEENYYSILLLFPY